MQNENEDASDANDAKLEAFIIAKNCSICIGDNTSAYYLLTKYADIIVFLHIKWHNNMQEEVQKMHRFDYSFLDIYVL